MTLSSPGLCARLWRGRRALLVAGLVLMVAAPAGANTRYDWRLRFRTVRTAHFDIHAHQGEEALARRLATIVEAVRARFEPTLGVPHGRVQVILVDQTDLSNGFATPIPYNTIEITAAPPGGETLIGNTTNWLELVFTHEYTHILHLDRSRGWMGGLRHVFGRVPIVFPNAFLPIWQIEGLATFEESRMTGEGRVPAGDFRAIVDVAAAHHAFLSMDRAGGGLDRWPSGNAPYAYGGYFHRYLADRFGVETIAALADATAGRVPFFGTGAFADVFGKSIGELWRDFRRAREAAAPAAASTDGKSTRLSRHGFTVTAPRIAADGTIYYAIANAEGFPALMRVRPGEQPGRVAWRYLGGGTAVGADWIVFDQLERARTTALFSDLYAVQRSGGEVRRLTRQARAADPDLSPDGRRVACTVQSVDRRGLAIVDFDPARTLTPRIVLADDASDYSQPRWSPDGRSIVAARRVRGRGFELVLFDVATGGRRTLAFRRDARLVTPSWSRDGAYVLFAADLGDAPFDIYAIELASGEVSRVTETAGGARSPELTADGKTLVYVGYTADGYDLFSAPFERAAMTPAPDFRPNAEGTAMDHEAQAPESGSRGLRAQADATGMHDRTNATESGSGAVRVAAEAHAYRPWRTLTPTYWTPVVETDSDEWLVGAGTAMTDALGRHVYAIAAAWASRARPDWNLAYAYDRWAPTLFASYSDDTDPFGGGDLRSRELTAGMLLPFRRIRWSETLLAAFSADRDDIHCADACDLAARQQRRSLRGGWMHDSRRAFGYSIGPEEGFQIEAAGEESRAASGADANASAAIVDLRGFRRLTRTHAVVAGRVAFAGSWGDARITRRFSAGGSGPAIAAFDFGRDTIGLLRGIAADDLIGTRAAVGNLDLRVPLARPQRGIGNWPVFFRTVHAAAFLDAGHAWSRSLRARDLSSSFGGELSVDLVLGHGLPATVTSGAAWTRDPIRGRSQLAFFARIGRAF